MLSFWQLRCCVGNDEFRDSRGLQLLAKTLECINLFLKLVCDRLIWLEFSDLFPSICKAVRYKWIMLVSFLFDLYLAVKRGDSSPIYLLSLRLSSSTCLSFWCPCWIHNMQVALTFRRMLREDTPFNYGRDFGDIGTAEQPFMIYL